LNCFNQAKEVSDNLFDVALNLNGFFELHGYFIKDVNIIKDRVFHHISDNQNACVINVFTELSLNAL
jgi:hypothetical protein